MFSVKPSDQVMKLQRGFSFFDLYLTNMVILISMFYPAIVLYYFAFFPQWITLKV